MLSLKSSALKQQHQQNHNLCQKCTQYTRSPGGSGAGSMPKKFSWVDNFRKLHNDDKYLSRVWFWDNFNWKKQSIWIGKFNKSNNLPDSDQGILEFLKKLIDDLNIYEDIKSRMYIKFYYSRNIKTHEPEINYLLICNELELPVDFSKSLVSVTFDRYQLTENILNRDRDFKRMINHYLNWSNFYTYYNLMGELQF